MWNPFTRKDAPSGSRAPEEPAARGTVLDPFESDGIARTLRNKIAEVHRMGPTAVATLTVTELTQEKGVELLADLLDELAETGAKHFILDIQTVQFMDSACLGCLV